MIKVEKSNLKNPVYLRNIGIEILAENLGNVGAVMFLQEFDVGTGDYTKERRATLENETIEDFERDLMMLQD